MSIYPNHDVDDRKAFENDSSVKAPANDNCDLPNQGVTEKAVREIDLGLHSAQMVTHIVTNYTCDDLSGAPLLHAARDVARQIYLMATPENRVAFADFATGVNDVLITRNLLAIPNDLETTPNNREPAENSRIFALANAGLGLACGVLPIAVSNENGGRYDRHVRLVKGLEHEPSSAGAAELGPHTEHSFRSHGGYGQWSPQVDTLCIVGLRNSSAEPTGYAVLQDVLVNTPGSSVATLHEAIFGMDPPNSSEARGTVWGLPILYRRHGVLECAYRADKVHVPERPDARKAIDDLNVAIAAASRSVTLLPGTAWLARNPRCFHWRDHVIDPSRWLLRTFGLAPQSAAIFSDFRRPDLVKY